MALIRNQTYMKGIFMALIMFAARSGIFIAILFYIVDGKILTAENVFFVISYFQILRQTMTVYFPAAITQVKN